MDLGGTKHSAHRRPLWVGVLSVVSVSAHRPAHRDGENPVVFAVVQTPLTWKRAAVGYHGDIPEGTAGKQAVLLASVSRL